MKHIDPEAIMGKTVGGIEQGDQTLRLYFSDDTVLDVEVVNSFNADLKWADKKEEEAC